MLERFQTLTWQFNVSQDGAEMLVPKKKEATAVTPSLLKQICKVTDLSISFDHVKMSSTLVEVMQKRRYYQYQCFMRGIELLQDLIHDGVGQVGDHRQLHLPERSRGQSVC